MQGRAGSERSRVAAEPGSCRVDREGPGEPGSVKASARLPKGNRTPSVLSRVLTLAASWRVD